MSSGSFNPPHIGHVEMAIAAGTEMKRIHAAAAAGVYETYRIVFCPVHKNYLENKYLAEGKNTTQCLSAQARCKLFEHLFNSVQTSMKLVADAWEEEEEQHQLLKPSGYWADKAKGKEWIPKHTISSTDLMLHYTYTSTDLMLQYPINCFLAGYDNFANIKTWDFGDEAPFNTRSLCVVGRGTDQLNTEFDPWTNETFKRAVIDNKPYEYSKGSWTSVTNVTEEPLLVGLPPLKGTLAKLSATKLKLALQTFRQESSYEEKIKALQIVKDHGYQNVESLTAFV